MTATFSDSHYLQNSGNHLPSLTVSFLRSVLGITSTCSALYRLSCGVLCWPHQVSQVMPPPPAAGPAGSRGEGNRPGSGSCVTCPPGRRPNGFLWALGLGGAITHLAIEPRPPGGEHVLAEPGPAPAAALPGGGVQDLHVRVARHPVHAEVGRLPRPARLGAAHACGNKWERMRERRGRPGRASARPAGHVRGWHGDTSPLAFGQASAAFQPDPGMEASH